MTPRAKLLSTVALSLALGLGIWAAHADPPGGTLDTFPGMPPVTDPVNLYRRAEPGRRRSPAARLCAEPAIERRLCHRSRGAPGRRPVPCRGSAAAHRPVLGSEDPVGQQ